MIRPLQYEDLNEFLNLSEKIYHDLNLDQHGHSFRKEGLLRLVRQGLRVQLEVYHNQLRGIVAWMPVPCHTDITLTQAIEVIWHAAPTLPAHTQGKILLRLLRAMETDAAKMGMKNLYINTTVEPRFKAVARALQRRNYTPTILQFTKPLTPPKEQA